MRGRLRRGGLRRVLIDCSFINFGGQPSGIPRVVLAYVEVGYAWGRRNGVEVIPVVPSVAGLHVVRPVPGRGAPDWLRRAVSPETEAAAPLRAAAFERLRAGFAQWLALSIFHLAFAAVALLNLRSLWDLEARARGWIERRYGVPPYAAASPAAGLLIEPGPGDLLFCPAYWHDVRPEIYEGIRARGARIVTLVHDVLPILLAQFYVAPWRDLFRDNVHAVFRYADAIFTVSSYTGAAVREIAQRGQHRARPIVTAYNGFEPLAEAAYMADYVAGRIENHFGNARLRAVIRSGEPPYLMVGSIEPKKAHIPALRCFEAMWRGGYARNLVVIGRRAWMSDEIAAAIEGSPYFGTRLFWFNDLSDFDLAYAYATAHGLIFCSISEGFGIPMIEASYYGRPTIAYDTTIAREVLGDLGCFFRDGPSFVDRVCELEDPAVHAERARLARTLDWPTWSAYAPRVFDALRAVHDGDPVPDVISRRAAGTSFDHEEPR